jgi:hypothetical protein
MNEKETAFVDGARYVLTYLTDVFEGVEETDIWAEFFTESEAGE